MERSGENQGLVKWLREYLVEGRYEQVRSLYLWTFCITELVGVMISLSQKSGDDQNIDIQKYSLMLGISVTSMIIIFVPKRINRQLKECLYFILMVSMLELYCQDDHIFTRLSAYLLLLFLLVSEMKWTIFNIVLLVLLLIYTQVRIHLAGNNILSSLQFFALQLTHLKLSRIHFNSNIQSSTKQLQSDISKSSNELGDVAQRPREFELHPLNKNHQLNNSHIDDYSYFEKEDKFKKSFNFQRNGSIIAYKKNSLFCEANTKERIQEEKHSKEQFMRVSVNLISAGVVLLNQDKQCVYRNKVIKRFIGNDLTEDQLLVKLLSSSLSIHNSKNTQTKASPSSEKIIQEGSWENDVKKILRKKSATQAHNRDQKQGSFMLNQNSDLRKDVLKHNPNYLIPRKIATIDVVSQERSDDERRDTPYVKDSISAQIMDEQRKRSAIFGETSGNAIDSIRQNRNISRTNEEPSSTRMHQCLIPDKIDIVFQKEGVQIQDVVNYLLMNALSKKTPRFNTSINILSDWKVQNKFSKIPRSKKLISREDKLCRSEENVNAIQEQPYDEIQEDGLIEENIQLGRGVSNSARNIIDRKTKNHQDSHQKGNQMKHQIEMYKYFVENNYLHVYVKMQDKSKEGAQQEIKFSCLARDNERFVLIEVREMNRVLKELIDEKLKVYKNRVLSSVSHELRTPLNCSILMLDMLAANEDVSDLIKQVFVYPALHSNTLLLSIINDILDLAQINYGEFCLTFEEVDLQKLCAECVTLVSMQAMQKDITLELDYDPSIPQFINTDPSRLRQVLLNLLGNALKFTQEGTIIIRTSAESRNLIRIDVQDTGCGIPALHLNNIIGKFGNQSDLESDNLNTAGGGLGLTIANNLASGLGGNRKISVKSTENVGSIFSFFVVNQDENQIGCIFKQRNIFCKRIMNWECFSQFSLPNLQPSNSMIESPNSYYFNSLNSSAPNGQHQHAFQKNKSCELLQIHKSSDYQHQKRQQNLPKKSEEQFTKKKSCDQFQSSLMNGKFNEVQMMSLIRFNTDIINNDYMKNTILHQPSPTSMEHHESSHANEQFEDTIRKRFKLSVRGDLSPLSDNKSPNLNSRIISEGTQIQITSPQNQFIINESQQNLKTKTSEWIHRQIQQSDQNSIKDIDKHKMMNKSNSLMSQQEKNDWPLRSRKTLNFKTSNKLLLNEIHQGKSNFQSEEDSQMQFRQSLSPSKIQNNHKYNKFSLVINQSTKLQQDESCDIRMPSELSFKPVPNEFICSQTSHQRLAPSEQNAEQMDSLFDIKHDVQPIRILFKNNIQDGLIDENTRSDSRNQSVPINNNQDNHQNDDNLEISFRNESSIQLFIPENNKNNQMKGAIMDSINTDIKHDYIQNKEDIFNVDDKQYQMQTDNSLRNIIDRSSHLCLLLPEMPLSSKKIDLNKDQKINLISKNVLPVQSLKQRIIDFNVAKQCTCANVLIVDDNEFNLYALEVRLKQYSLRVEKASSGESAIQLVQNKFMKKPTCCQQYSIIFMDIDMPLKNGYETTQEILSFLKRKNVSKFTIISACSAYVQESEKIKAKKSGMSFYISKPVNTNALENVLFSSLFPNQQEI